MNDFLRTLTYSAFIVIPIYLILFGFAAYGETMVKLSSSTDSNSLFGFEGYNGTWTKVQPLEQTWKVNIPYKRPDIFAMCSLTFEKPFYDCNEIWLIFQLYGSVDGVVCIHGTAGCAYYDWNIIWMEYNPDFRDKCGRTILIHELLHLKYGVGTMALIHNQEKCTNW